MNIHIPAIVSRTCMGILLSYIFGSAAFCSPVNPSDIYIVDGDTIEVVQQRIRLVGFDTPETYRSKCDYELALGNAATDRLQDLIHSGNLVDLVMLPGLDKYGRGLGRLYIGGVDVAETLTLEGLARPYQGGRREGWCNG